MAVSTAQMDLDGISSTGFFLVVFPITNIAILGCHLSSGRKLGIVDIVVSPQCRMARPECLFRMPPIIRSPGKGPWTWPFGVQRWKSGIRHLQDLERAQIDPNRLHMSMNGIPKSWNQDPERSHRVRVFHWSLWVAWNLHFIYSSKLSPKPSHPEI